MADDRDARIAQLEAENAALRSEVGRLGPALAEAEVQRIATSDILRVIASSPTELRAALDLLAESAARICGADWSVIQRLEGERLVPVGFSSAAVRDAHQAAWRVRGNVGTPAHGRRCLAER